MEIGTKKYWIGAHKIYQTLPWINDESIFSQQVIKFFPKNGKLLELGAGSGQDSRYFSKHGFQVTSTDFSSFAIDIAKKKAKQEHLEINFLNLDISKKLPFENDTFDIIYSHLALHYWDEKETRIIFKETYRVLKPGGILAILLNSKTDPEVELLEKVGENLYKDPKGIFKSYFTSNYLTRFIDDNYKILLSDDGGETYKDKIKTLVRFVGEKR